jgi:hypothetical protein
MTLFLSLVALLPRIFLGFFIVHFVWNAKDGKSLLVKIFLSAGVGFGVSSLLGFLWIWAGLPITVYAWVESIVAILLMIWLLIQNHHLLRMPQIPVKQELLWFLFLAIGVLFFALNLFLYGLQYPHGRPDAWINWNVVARFIYLGGSDWQATFLRQWDHPDYPLFVPMMNAITWVFLGGTSTWGPIALHFMLSLFTAGLLFSLVNIFRDTKQAVLSVIFFTAFPFIIDQGMRQYSDFLLAYLLLGAGGLTLLFIQTKEDKLILLAGLLVGLSGWAKNEGLPAILGFSFLWGWLSFQKREWKLVRYYLAGLVFPLLVLALFKLFLAPSNDLMSVAGSALPKLLEVDRYFTILQKGWAMLWSLGNAPLPLIGFIIFMVVFVGRSRQHIPGLWILSALIVFQMIVYFCIYLLTPLDLTFHLNTSLDRLYMHVLLLVFLWLFVWLRSPQELISKES